VGTADRCARCAVAPALRAVVAAPVDEVAALRSELVRLSAQLAAVEVERDAAIESARTIRAAALREHALDQLDQAQAMIDAALAILREQ
jgi:phage I-like protein